MADIVDTAVSAGQFRTLVTAVQAAGLVDTLKGKGPFTVFAPSDDAFAKLPAGTVESLLKDIPKLRAVLTYHVVPGAVHAKDALSLTSGGKDAQVATVQGASVRVHQEGLIRHHLMVNDATVVTPDIETSNGVIHVIDRVILPPA